MNEKNILPAAKAPDAMQQTETAEFKPIDVNQINELITILNKYRAGKKSIDGRIVSAEQWYKLRNTEEEAKEGHNGKGFRSSSAWLHNVITSKHADAMDAYPEPNFLPREQSDKAQAAILSKIVPCIMEKNKFEKTYSDNSWGKNKFGTGVYKTIWDKSKLNGLGDISITRCNILNLFWQPGLDDIQQSKYFFEVDFQDEDEVREAFPEQLPEGKSIPKSVYTSKFKYDDAVDTTDKVPVINCYYKKRGVLHYVLFVPGTVLYATENDTEIPTVQVTDPVTGETVSIPTGEKPMSERGIYDHGRYPYTFDALFPIEGSPCGYGFVDICKNPQLEIDLMKTAFIKNTMAGATPRYFANEAAGINDAEFLDLDKTIIKVKGGQVTGNLMPVDYRPLSGGYISMLDHDINELRETTGNTETATGTTNSGVTAASAIAALQEASGKGSRDASMSAYRAYQDICEIVLELIRQFYDMPRQFRITGNMGEEQFVYFDNAGLKPQPQIGPTGEEMGNRLPVFDIRIVPQKRNAYTKMANNDLALQFYGLGFFNPQLADQAIACLSIMDFDGKDELLRIIQRNGTLFDKFNTLLQLAAMLAAKYNDAAAFNMIQQVSMQGASGAQRQMLSAPMQQANNGFESSRMSNARNHARTAAMPTEGGFFNT